MASTGGRSVSRAPSLSGPSAPRTANDDAAVLLFSACRDHQTAADAVIEGKPQVLLAIALIRCERAADTWCDLTLPFPSANGFRF